MGAKGAMGAHLSHPCSVVAGKTAANASLVHVEPVCDRDEDVLAAACPEAALNLAHGHSARIERQDLVIEPGEPALVLGDQPRLKRPVAIARHIASAPSSGFAPQGGYPDDA